MGFYPRWLNEDEMKQPYIVLDQFFASCNLPKWRERLYEWVKESLSATPDEEVYDPDEILINYEMLNKLLEATHLIYIREWQKKP